MLDTVFLFVKGGLKPQQVEYGWHLLIFGNILAMAMWAFLLYTMLENRWP